MQCNQLLLLLQHQSSRIETMTSLETSVNWTEQASVARVELSVPRELVRFSLPDIENTEEQWENGQSRHHVISSLDNRDIKCLKFQVWREITSTHHVMRSFDKRCLLFQVKRSSRPRMTTSTLNINIYLNKNVIRQKKFWWKRYSKFVNPWMNRPSFSCEDAAQQVLYELVTQSNVTMYCNVCHWYFCLSVCGQVENQWQTLN